MDKKNSLAGTDARRRDTRTIERGHRSVSRTWIPTLILLAALLIQNAAVSELNAPHDDGNGRDGFVGDGTFTTDGLWDIQQGDVVEFSDVTILSTASIVVRGGGMLNLTNVTLHVGTDSATRPVIDIQSLGEMNLRNCSVAPARGNYIPPDGYTFWFRNGARGLLEDCSVREVNSTIGSGLLIESSMVTVRDSTFNTSSTGTTVRNCSPSISNSTFRDNGVGLYILSSSAWPVMVTENCIFEHNGIGTYIDGISNPRLRRCGMVENTVGIECRNINFQTRFPTIGECNITDNDLYGVKVTNSKVRITGSHISGSQIGLYSNGCTSSFPYVDGGDIRECGQGVFVNGSPVELDSVSVDRCGIGISGENLSDITLDGVVITGGSSTGTGLNVKSSLGMVRDCTISTVRTSFGATNSTLRIKNSSIATPSEYWIRSVQSNVTLLNSTSHASRTSADNGSLIIEGGFHSIKTLRKNGSAAEWVDLSIRSPLYNKSVSTDYFGSAEGVILHHHRVKDGGVPDRSYGVNTIIAIYRDHENHFVRNVTVGETVELVLNVPPDAEDVELVPSAPKTTDTLRAKWTFTDHDEMDSQLGSILTWFNNGVHRPELDNETAVDRNLTQKGDVWQFTITVSDGQFWSAQHSSDPVSVENSAPVIEGAEDLVVEQGSETSIYLAISDADDDPLEALLLSDVGWSRLSDDHSEITVRAPTDVKGPFSFEIRVSDGTFTSNKTFVINVMERDDVAHLPVLVVNETGEAVQGANVSLGAMPVMTDMNGSALIRNVSGGMKTITIWKKGYWPVDKSLFVVPGKVEKIEVVLRSISTTTYSFRVLDTMGRGVSGVVVSLDLYSFDVPGIVLPPDCNVSLWIEGYPEEWGNSSGSDGSIRIPDLYPGRYRITAVKGGFESYNGTVSIDGVNMPRQSLVLYRDDEKTMGYVEGTVLSGEGLPLAGVSIELISGQGGAPVFMKTDEKGEFKTGSLAKGTYTIRIDHDDYVHMVDEIVVQPKTTEFYEFSLEREVDGTEQDVTLVRFILVFTGLIVWALFLSLFFITFYKKKKLKSADEIIADEEDKKKREKEIRDDEYRRKIYTALSDEKPLEALAELGEELAKKNIKREKDMAIFDEIVERRRYGRRGDDFEHTGYGEVFSKYMEGDEIEFIDEDVVWGGEDFETDPISDEDLLDVDDEGMEEDEENDAFSWTD